jgi:hypothetical protein
VGIQLLQTSSPAFTLIPAGLLTIEGVLLVSRRRHSRRRGSLGVEFAGGLVASLRSTGASLRRRSTPASARANSSAAEDRVDLAARTIIVRRSYDGDTTKGGHADTIPIAAELIPYLEAAIAASPSDLVFPGADGNLRSENAQVEITLRRALRRAAICLGYEHKCRAKGCGHVERPAHDQMRLCPTHNHRMWPVGIVRPIRFHDLRYTTGSLLAMRGVDTPALQRILRHRDPRITMATYVHLTPGYLRSEIDRLTFEEKADPAPDATRLLPAPSTPGSDATEGALDPQEPALLGAERDIGFEPTTFSLGS